MNDAKIHRQGQWYAMLDEGYHATETLDPGVSFEVWEKVGEGMLNVTADTIDDLITLLQKVKGAIGQEASQRTARSRST